MSKKQHSSNDNGHSDLSPELARLVAHAFAELTNERVNDVADEDVDDLAHSLRLTLAVLDWLRERGDSDGARFELTQMLSRALADFGGESWGDELRGAAEAMAVVRAARAGVGFSVAEADALINKGLDNGATPWQLVVVAVNAATCERQSYKGNLLSMVQSIVRFIGADGTCQVIDMLRAPTRIAA